MAFPVIARPGYHILAHISIAARFPLYANSTTIRFRRYGTEFLRGASEEPRESAGRNLYGIPVRERKKGRRLRCAGWDDSGGEARSFAGRAFQAHAMIPRRCQAYGGGGNNSCAPAAINNKPSLPSRGRSIAPFVSGPPHTSSLVERCARPDRTG